MANHMPEVAKMLGVEIGEEFEINKQDGVFVLCYDGLLHTQSGFMCNELLYSLLFGKYTIKCKPWKPKEGESYYVVETNGFIGVEEWWAETIDMNYYKLGNCYRTEEEAEANRDKWVAFYTSDEVLEV